MTVRPVGRDVGESESLEGPWRRAFLSGPAHEGVELGQPEGETDA